MEHIAFYLILGPLCFFNLFLIYDGASGTSYIRMNRKVLNGLTLVEFVAVTAYAIISNLHAPSLQETAIHSLFLEILGLNTAYVMIFMAWISCRVHTLLDEEKTYEMTLKNVVCLSNELYYDGVIINNKREIEVLLPYEEEYWSSDTPRKIDVKFKTVAKKQYILVEPVKEI